MFCKNCGAKIEEGGKFCKHCGHPLDIPAEPKPLIQPNPAPDDNGSGRNALSEKVSKPSRQGRDIAILILVLGGAAFLFYFMIEAILTSSLQPLATPFVAANSNNIGATESNTQISSPIQTAPQQPTQAPPVASGQTNQSTNNQQPQEIPSDSSGNLSPSLINQIEPAIVEINCYPAGSNSVRIQGSGTSVNVKGTIEITSNFHVYGMAVEGSALPTCYAVYPQPPDYSYNYAYGDYQLTLIGEHYDATTYQDSAIFELGQLYPSATALSHVPVINDAPVSGLNSNCGGVEVGDTVTIFGYPSSGNLLGISETVTHGIISGLVTGPIYKTDAPIDHGNSGGLAILNKNQCALGIPTLGESGLTAGIGYIQSFALALSTSNNSTQPQNVTPAPSAPSYSAPTNPRYFQLNVTGVCSDYGQNGTVILSGYPMTSDYSIPSDDITNWTDGDVAFTVPTVVPAGTYQVTVRGYEPGTGFCADVHGGSITIH